MTIAKYLLDDETVVLFEVDPGDGFGPAGLGQFAGRIREAAGPAIDAARVVLAKAEEAGPDSVEVRFGIKVSGGADWIVARSAGEASFEITLTWVRQEHNSDTGHGVEHGPMLGSDLDPRSA